MDLVTGATGHIGNVLVRELLARGNRVRTLVRPGRKSFALEDLSVEIVHGDILEPATLIRAMQGVDTVYHLAAHIDLNTGDNPRTDRVNLEGTANMLLAARGTGIKRLVYASSIYAMHAPASGRIDETCPFDVEYARGAYDRSKAAASLAVQQAAKHDLNAVLVCPTAVTGPFDFNCSEAGRGILYNISPGIKFTVDGAYDFVDVRDVARGMIAAAACGRRGETYILGSERLTVQQVAKIIWNTAGGWHMGIHLPDWIADLAAEIVPSLSEHPIVTPYSLAAIRSNSYISHEKASRELDYSPRPAAQAIIDAVRWWQIQLEAPVQLQEPLAHSPV